MRGEIPRQLVEQFSVRRLARPRSGQRGPRVLPRQIERIHRVYDAEAEELLPDQVDRGARELRMSRQHPRELRPQRFAQIGFLACQHKGRMNLAAIALQSDLAPSLRVVTGPVFGDRVAVLIRHHADAGLAEEGRHGPEIAALLRNQVETDLFEEALAAVTRDALVVDAEEDAPR